MRTHVSDLVRSREFLNSGEGQLVREKAGLSRAEMAEAVEVSHGTVWRWETGKSVPRGAAAIRYLRILDEIERAVA